MPSTETAVLKVFSDLVDAIEKGEFASLTYRRRSTLLIMRSYLRGYQLPSGLTVLPYGGSNPTWRFEHNLSI